MNDQLFYLDQSQMLNDINMNKMTGSEHIDSTCGSEIVPKLEAQLLDKNMELDQLRSKLRRLEEENIQLRQTIQIQKENYENRIEEQERMHNREIVELKCNLDNSIFGDQQENELQVIQEENEIKSLVQSQVSPNKIETNILLRILDQIDVEDTIEWQDQETQIICKVTKLVEMLQKMELELDDWKHNYWMLEKKLNQILLQQQDKLLKQGSEEIEIEYDFKQKKIVKKSQDKQKTQQQSTYSVDEVQQFLDEIKRLKQLNSELIQQIKINTKQMLEQLIVKQMKNETKCLTQISEPGIKQPIAMRNNNSQHQKQIIEHRNHYFSQYFQHQSMRIQPQQQQQQQQQQQLNDHSYDQPKTTTPTTYTTPILLKYASGSPFNQTNKVLQF